MTSWDMLQEAMESQYCMLGSEGDDDDPPLLLKDHAVHTATVYRSRLGGRHVHMY